MTAASDPRDDEALQEVALEDAQHTRESTEQDLVQTREALRQHAELLRLTLASIGDGVITTDTSGTVLSLNHVAQQLTGWSAEDALGRPLDQVFRIIDENSRAPAESPVARALRENAVVGLANHTLLVARDGTEIPIDDSAAPIRDDDGRVRGAVMVFRNVAARRESELIRAQLAAIVQSSQDAIVSKTLDSRILSWNAGAEQLFGYPAAEVIGKSITVIIPAERHDEEAEILERIRRGQRVEHYETVRITRSGRRVHVSLTISPIHDAEGRVVGASKIARDITGRKRAEQRLITQNRVTRLLAEAATLEEAAPAILEAICEHLEWQVGALWRVDEEQQHLRCVEMFHRPLTQAPAFEASSRSRTLERGTGLPGEVWATGTAQWVPDVTREPGFLRAAPAEADGLHGAFGFPILVNRDLVGVMEFFSHEIREPDDDLLQMMTALGSQVGQFIQRASLVATLREADRRKDEFLAMLAHELRNPLAPILNAVRIMRAKQPPVPELQWATDVVHRQALQMSRLVDDLLDVSRITRGRIELRRELVELSTVVAAAVEATRPLMDKWGHHLTVTVPSDSIILDADPTRLGQVVQNLLGNAAKFTERNGRIELIAEAGPGSVTVTIRDNGVGIPRDMLTRVFDLFTQADRSLDRAHGGLGIGLTLVQRLVELHGGTVTAHSDGPGTGAEFVVRLPTARLKSAAPLHGPAGTSAEGGGLRILVVDDNRDAGDSLGLLLRLLGHEVHAAHDGLEAVGAAAAFKPDVVLLDIGLPKLGGYDVARQIRAQEGGGDVMLIALTGWGQDHDRRRSRDAGFDHHLTKPVELEVLQRLLADRSRYLGVGRAARPEGKEQPE